MTFAILALLSFVFAAIPTWLFLRNVTVFRRLPCHDAIGAKTLPSLSVLIPARNEEAAIAPCLESILDQRTDELQLEVVVLDDQSEDSTADRVRDFVNCDSRVRLESAKPLPPGWCGKQHACAQLGKLARHEILIFLDADVRLAPDSLTRIAHAYQVFGVDLLSGFPRQRTESFAERMLIPLIHFVLLCFLSLRQMRRSSHPAFGAGCGQLFVTSGEAYRQSGGHGKIRGSLHDGLKLPRLYRGAGLKTDLFDGTDIATCRMYRDASSVWHGLKKNATEGVANAGLILPVTAMLFFGQVLPYLLLSYALFLGGPVETTTMAIVVAACVVSLLPRLVSAFRYQQSLFGVILHPVAIVLFLLIQWSAFVGSFSKKTVTWKGRPYPSSS